MTLTEHPPCAFPPHPDSAEPDTPVVVAESALSRFRGWLRHAPAERLPLPAIPVVWTAAEIMHTAGVSGLYPGMATAAAVLGGGWLGERHARDPHQARMRGAEVAAVTGAVGSWMTAATAWGALAGPDHLMSLAYLAGAAGGYWWLRRHDAVRAARARRDEAAAWRERKTAWHRLAPRLGLRGSHLLAYEETLLGDTTLIDTRGTGKRASQVSAREVAERLGELEMISVGRIDVTTDPIPGRLRITVRRNDPWKHALAHPAVDPASPYARYVEYPASCRKPLVIGGDPETGAPFQLVLWDEDEGAKVIFIGAKKGSGKSVLLSCIKERVTACTDARLIQVNLSKAREDRRWEPLAIANALGMDASQTRQARRILRWVLAAIVARSEDPSLAASKVEPTPGTPLLVVTIDEIDMVAGDPECKALLAKIASKCRSEGVALILAGQRATVQWMGGGDLRANVDIAVLGRFARAAEARKMTGEESDLPDMGAYGEGAPGVFLVTELGGGGGYDRGRVFKLSEPGQLDRIVADRLASQRPYVPEPGFARMTKLWGQITGAIADDAPGSADTVQDDLGGLGLDLTDDADENAAVAAKIAAARELAAQDPELAEIPPEMRDHAAAMLAERRSQFLAQLTDVTVPDLHGSILVSLLCAPGGTSSREAAQAISERTGTDTGRMTVYRWLKRLEADGHAEVRGRGSGQRFYLTGATADALAGQSNEAADRAGTYPGLRVIQGGRTAADGD
jgi:hypothetical protein